MQKWPRGKLTPHRCSLSWRWLNNSYPPHVVCLRGLKPPWDPDRRGFEENGAQKRRHPLAAQLFERLVNGQQLIRRRLTRHVNGIDVDALAASTQLMPPCCEPARPESAASPQRLRQRSGCDISRPGTGRAVTGRRQRLSNLRIVTRPVGCARSCGFRVFLFRRTHLGNQDTESPCETTFLTGAPWSGSTLRSDTPTRVDSPSIAPNWPESYIIATISVSRSLVRLSAALVFPGPPSASRSNQHETFVRTLRCRSPKPRTSSSAESIASPPPACCARSSCCLAASPFRPRSTGASWSCGWKCRMNRRAPPSIAL